MNLQIIEVVNKSNAPKTIKTKIDEFTEIATKAFDYEFDGTSYFYPFEIPKKLPKEFNIGLIVGASGTGKSTFLSYFGEEEHVDWNGELAVISHFETPTIAMNKLSAVGFNSIPSWAKPFHVLSNGEQFRANLARRIKDSAVIDEFTSVVDRTVAKATSTSISKFIKRNNIKNVVFSSCHSDIIDWLEPDWIFDTNEGVLYDGRLVRRPKINIEIFSIEKNIWRMFEPHHYLDNKLNKAARCYGAIWDGELVGFTAVLPMPSGTLKNAWREHRTVILPDYQGMGVGVALSDAIAKIFIKQGLKYFSRSAHPRFGNHRNNGSEWRETGTSGKLRANVNDSVGTKHKENNPNWKYDDKRVCYSHEYVGKDYYEKQHLRIAFNFKNCDNLPYEEFEKNLDKILQNAKDKRYLTFITGKPKLNDTFAEIYAKKNGVRQENLWDDSFDLKKYKLNEIILVGKDDEFEEIFKTKDVLFSKIKGD